VSSGPVANPSQAPTAAQFLADYPAFDTASVTDPAAVQFSPEAVAYWLQMAGILLNQGRLGSVYYLATELFVAHNLALEAWAEQGGDQTIPGLSKGAIAGATSTNVSVNYNNAATLEPDAGHWNYTMYGGRFIRLIRTLCAGPLYAGGGGCAGPYNGPAWPGPWCWNFPNPTE